jgi:catechol 2,3-dioxygenase-like lactoylglutathione lyase family enzyme
MGHVHFVTRDIEAHRRFWTLLGGTPTKNGSLDMFQFPGVFVLVRQGDSSGAPRGSAMDHIGFHVQRIGDWLPKFAAAGLAMESVRPTQVMVTGPEDVRVEFMEEPSIGVPIKMHHLHYMVADPLAAQAWYQKMFGAVPGKRGAFDTGDLPGVSLTFGKATGTVAKTQGAGSGSRRF